MNALTPEQLAAERAASLERQRRARESEPRHRPLPYTGRERSRMWRVRSVEEEWEEDRRAMEAEVVGKGKRGIPDRKQKISKARTTP